MTTLNDILNNIAYQAQRQDSTSAQMLDLVPFANRLGCSDAAEYLEASASRLVQRQPLTTSLEKALNSFSYQAARQDGVVAQLRDLRLVANKLGLYDAADLIEVLVERGESQSRKAA